MGIDRSMFKYAEEYLKEEENIYIVNISTDYITVSSLMNSKDKNKKNITKSDVL